MSSASSSRLPLLPVCSGIVKYLDWCSSQDDPVICAHPYRLHRLRDLGFRILDHVTFIQDCKIPCRLILLLMTPLNTCRSGFRAGWTGTRLSCPGKIRTGNDGVIQTSSNTVIMTSSDSVSTQFSQKNRRNPYQKWYAART